MLWSDKLLIYWSIIYLLIINYFQVKPKQLFERWINELRHHMTFRQFELRGNAIELCEPGEALALKFDMLSSTFQFNCFAHLHGI